MRSKIHSDRHIGIVHATVEFTAGERTGKCSEYDSARFYIKGHFIDTILHFSTGYGMNERRDLHQRLRSIRRLHLTSHGKIPDDATRRQSFDQSCSRIMVGNAETPAVKFVCKVLSNLRSIFGKNDVIAKSDGVAVKIHRFPISLR